MNRERALSAAEEADDRRIEESRLSILSAAHRTLNAALWPDSYPKAAAAPAVPRKEEQ